ncbi:hypothetical protein PTKIN_Ptkin08bG0099600 [Pterospermum kingtungense]
MLCSLSKAGVGKYGVFGDTGTVRNQNLFRPLLCTDVVCERWHRPPLGFLKCNVDAPIFAQEGEMSFGIVTPDDSGDFVAARTCCIDGCLQVREAKAFGILEALSWVHALNLEQLIF